MCGPGIMKWVGISPADESDISLNSADSLSRRWLRCASAPMARESASILGDGKGRHLSMSLNWPAVRGVIRAQSNIPPARRALSYSPNTCWRAKNSDTVGPRPTLSGPGRKDTIGDPTGYARGIYTDLISVESCRGPVRDTTILYQQ